MMARLKIEKSVMVQTVKATQSRIHREFFFSGIGGYKKFGLTGCDWGATGYDPPSFDFRCESSFLLWITHRFQGAYAFKY
jgi:hypothetical protein